MFAYRSQQPQASPEQSHHQFEPELVVASARPHVSKTREIGFELISRKAYGIMRVSRFRVRQKVVVQAVQ